MKKIIVLLMVLIIALAAAFVGLTAVGGPCDKNDNEIRIVKIEQGSGTGQIASVLLENECIKSTNNFKLISKIYRYDGTYKAGTYAISPSMTMKEIMEIIKSGKTMANNFTVIEGWTVEKIAANLDQAGVVSYEDFMKEEEHGKFDYDFLVDTDKSMYRLEGYLYPDTYQFEVDTDAHTVINTMLKHFDETVGDEIIEAAGRKGHSLHELLTVASIIEREAGTDEDMAKVSSVIYNRLDINMALQMDSIISYILQEDKVNLTYSDINVDSSYNPYKNTGLPPGPICSPEIKAIEAAIAPADTDYLYFVLSEKLDGTAAFTSDYNEFLKEKDAYYKAYEEKYGKDGE